MAGQPLGIVLYVASALVLVHFGIDVMVGAFPHSAALRGLKASLG